MDRFCKNVGISNSIRIHSVGAELFHADGRTDRWTDMTKLIIAFSGFANAPKNGDGFDCGNAYHLLFKINSVRINIAVHYI